MSTPLLIEWAPGRAGVFDPSSKTMRWGASLADCLGSAGEGKDAIIAISQRSAFIRSLHVPKASGAELKRIIAIQIASLLPVNAGEFAFGYRLGDEVPGMGRLAVVGAVKSDSLKRLFSEAQASGVRIKAVLPLAFGSWLAAKARAISDCAVVEVEGEAVNVDIIQGGELHYSRSLPRPENPTELDDEVSRTLSIANAPMLPVMSPGCPGLEIEIPSERRSIEFFDLKSIDKLLFTLELPELDQARQGKSYRWAVQRAVAAFIVMLGLSAYAFVSRMPTKSPSQSRATKSVLQAAKIKQTAAWSKLAKDEKMNRILDVAFKPSQSMSDMVTAISGSASQDSWLTGLTLGRNSAIAISGIAMNEGDVSKFAAELSKDPRFEEMKVVSTGKATIGKKQITQFEITGKPVGVTPFDHPPKARKKA